MSKCTQSGFHILLPIPWEENALWDIDSNQKIIPKLQFGKPIEDLSPLLPRSEFKKNMIVPALDLKNKNFTNVKYKELLKL